MLVNRLHYIEDDVVYMPAYFSKKSMANTLVINSLYFARPTSSGYHNIMKWYYPKVYRKTLYLQGFYSVGIHAYERTKFVQKEMVSIVEVGNVPKA